MANPKIMKFIASKTQYMESLREEDKLKLNPSKMKINNMIHLKILALCGKVEEDHNDNIISENFGKTITIFPKTIHKRVSIQKRQKLLSTNIFIPRINKLNDLSDDYYKKNSIYESKQFTMMKFINGFKSKSIHNKDKATINNGIPANDGLTKYKSEIELEKNNSLFLNDNFNIWKTQNFISTIRDEMKSIRSNSNSQIEKDSLSKKSKRNYDEALKSLINIRKVVCKKFTIPAKKYHFFKIHKKSEKTFENENRTNVLINFKSNRKNKNKFSRNRIVYQKFNGKLLNYTSNI